MSSSTFTPRTLLLLILFLSPLLSTTASATDAGEEEHDDNHRRTYIIHVRPPPPEHDGSHRDWHELFLPHPSHHLHSFTHALSGFSARLTPAELEALSKLDGFLYATPCETLPLHTTHSPAFLGLTTEPSGAWAKVTKYGKGVIIGVLDSGIAPTHPSFSAAGIPRPPSKWKGRCGFKNTSLCTNKLVGARVFQKGGESTTSEPFDAEGHGTHTASIAAGQFVAGASVLGSAKGTAAGIAPQAHLAMYKACGSNGCTVSDISAAIDVAVSDGVDVLSLSIGGRPQSFHRDPKAIAAFAAVKHGVIVVMSAGNDGPDASTVENVAPWVLTVGASTTDRRVRAVVKLGDGTVLRGESAYQPSADLGYLPVVAPLSADDPDASSCANVTTLRKVGVEGKLVFCDDGILDEVEKGGIVKEAGGAAMVIWADASLGNVTYAEANVIPTSHLAYDDGRTMHDYIASTSDPKATIEFQGTVIAGSSDPAVAAFSSRGPSSIGGGILKPDIVGPGVNILAAWPTPVGPVTVDPPFNMDTGTSMACPHLAGVAALVKSAHPTWSPAMIKSAIMTSTRITNPGGGGIIDRYGDRPAGLFAMGAGQVDPKRAIDQGLVYDAGFEDYIGYLCGLGYTDTQVRAIAGDFAVTCGKYPRIEEANLNYPSVRVVLGNSTGYAARVTRTLTNVGKAKSSYVASIVRPSGITVSVVPETLEFATVGQKQTFQLVFGVNGTEPHIAPWLAEGYLSWVPSAGSDAVRSPISVQVL